MTNPYRTIDIILADDHELIRDGFTVMLKKTPEINLIGEACNGEELVRLTRRLRPQVIVTDIKMPKMDGLEAVKIIKKEFPEIGIIVLTMFGEEDLIYDMCEAGATSYLLKDAHNEEIIAAIKYAHKNEPYFCKKILEKMTSANHLRSSIPQRTQFNDKEKQIIILICEECTNANIAARVKLSQRTVEDYRTRILIKTNSKNTAGLVRYAIRHKIFEND